MKINSAGGLDQYKNYVQSLKNGEASAKGQAETKAAGGGKTDTVSISGDAAARAEAGRLAAAVGAEVEQFAPAHRLEELREAVAAGSYFVEAEDIAAAMLDVEA